jgi:hypothetical protein
MRFLFAIVLSCSFLHVFGQIEYEKGYFINNDGVRSDCLIKNSDWFGSPDKIKYKNSENADAVSMNVSEIKELSVGDAKFIRQTVAVEISERDIRKLSVNKNPEWQEQTLFMRVLVEGKANLYYHRMKGFDRFFFSVDGGEIKQLVYKLYLLTDDEIKYNVYYHTNTNYGQNREYINQLQTFVYCATFSPQKVKQVKYERKPLTTYFTEYNACHGIVAVDHEKHNKTKVHLWITPGLNLGGSLSLQFAGGIPADRDFGKGDGFRLGTAVEFSLPFNKNKWAILLEPAYQSTKFSKATYESVETTFSLRYHFFLGKKSRIFLNGGMVGDISTNYNGTNFSADHRFSSSWAAGAGFSFGRFGVEARRYSTRTVEPDILGSHVNFAKYSLIFGFRIF